MRGSTAAAARRSNRCPIVAGCRGRPYGRLVCPWHQSAYDVDNGQMVRGPREDPRTRNDVQDADESLASWTRHRIGVRQRHRRRITGAPARFACPFLEPRTAINDQDRAPHLRGRFRTRRVHRATERAPVCIGIEQRSPRPVDMGEVSSGPCESRSSEQSCRARLRSRWHLPRIRQPPRRCASARTVGTTCLICTPVTRQRRSGRSITR